MLNRQKLTEGELAEQFDDELILKLKQQYDDSCYLAQSFYNRKYSLESIVLMSKLCRIFEDALPEI